MSPTVSKLWEKHGLQGQDHRHRRHRLDQCGDFRQRRVRADVRAVADAGGGEGAAPARHRQHHRQADHRNHDPQGHRRRRGLRSEGAAGQARANPQGPQLRDRRRQHRGARLSADRRAGRRARSGEHPRRADGGRQHAGRDADARRSTACRRCCRGRARARSRAPRCWWRAAPRAIRRICRRSPSTWWRRSPRPARSAARCARRWAAPSPRRWPSSAATPRARWRS